MIKLLTSYKKDDKLMQLTECTVLNKIKKVLAEFWLPPYEMEVKIKAIIDPLIKESPLQIVVSGETKNVALYIVSPTGVLSISPFSSINANVLLQEVYDEASLPKDCEWHIFPANVQLLRRLSLLKVLLINPCVLENFPIPRLSLNIGLLGSYLRKLQKANVRIVDMQIGSTINDVMNETIQFQPHLVGMSISYGQKYLALSILEEIYQAKNEGLINPLVVLGNIIPASFPKEFIEMYPDVIIACGEGELTILGLVEYLNGERELAAIPGIVYKGASGNIYRTLNASVPMESIPLPALVLLC